MSNHSIKSPKEFTSELRMFETTDRNHADVFNAVISVLINNEAFLKEIADAAAKHMENAAVHVPSMEGVGTGEYLRGDGTWHTPPDTNTIYTHPATHPASMITQDATHRFVSDTEKTTWNGKAGTGTASQSANGLMSAADKKKLDGITAGANAYSHPSGNGNNHIPAGGSSGQILRWSAAGTAAWGSDNNTTYNAATQSANGLMSAADKKKLDGIAAGANAYSHPANHAASMITQDATHRFVSDTEKTTWNNMTRIVYTGWGSSLSIPWGRGIHGIVVVDWRVFYVVCVQGNSGSRTLNKGIISVTYSESGATGVNFSFNQSTNALSCTTSAGGSTSIMYMGV